MKLQLIVAMTPDSVIGDNGQLPWKLPSDLRRFRQTTLGHAVIMGRKTFEGIVAALGRPLDGRSNIVLTQRGRKDVEARGGIPASSPEQALAFAKKVDDEPFVIGGAQVYEQLLPRVRTVHLTNVQVHIEGDTKFPAINLRTWKLRPGCIGLSRHDPNDEYASSYAVYDRL